MNDMLSQPGFIEPKAAVGIIEYSESLRNAVGGRTASAFGHGSDDLDRSAEELSSILESFRSSWRKHNDDHAHLLIQDASSMINPVEGRNLDEQQLLSIVTDVSDRLVIAGAGTGKTTTIVGLVKYLVGEGVDPSEILLLSYTNNAVDELRKRVREETSCKIQTYTFHSLAMHILRTADSSSPSVANTDIRSFVHDTMLDLLVDKSYSKVVTRYIVRYLGRVRENADGDIVSTYRKSNPFYSLSGMEMKSGGEVDIANYLLMNRIPFRYEDRYKVDVSDSEHGGYRPDFHIKDTDVYIEYFGVDSAGEVSPALSSKDEDASDRYNEQIEWKRSIHESNGTVMIELYYHQRLDGTMLDILESELSANGIVPDQYDIPSSVEAGYGMVSRAMSLLESDVASALTVIRESPKPYEKAYPKGDTEKEKDELALFEKVFLPVYERYIASLKSMGSIDFSDMIRSAVDRMEFGRYVSPYSYVIVDEYQDISQSRYSLLKAMRATKEYRLFCVGDDWQSIYRFNGSDVDYIMSFEKYWGPSHICRIEHTYRFSEPLLKKSSSFICINEQQVRKEMIGPKRTTNIVLVDGHTSDHALELFKDRMRSFPKESSVLFLGRYNHDVARLSCALTWYPIAGEKFIKVKDEERPDLDIRFMTMHGAKGLQADYVAILNNVMEGYGFPSLRSECLVLSKMMRSPNEDLQEERRLMYVAMTRSRKGTYVLSCRNRESVFVKELFPDHFPKIKSGETTQRCPLCNGTLVARKGNKGYFLGCSNYPVNGCRYMRKIE